MIRIIRLSAVIMVPADAKKIMDPAYVLEKDKCHGYIMPQIKSVDIDTILDFEYVRCILNLNKNHFE